MLSDIPGVTNSYLGKCYAFLSKDLKTTAVSTILFRYFSSVELSLLSVSINNLDT